MHCATCTRRRKTGPLIHRFRFVLIDENIRHDLRSHLETAIEQAVFSQIMKNVTAKAAHRTFFDRNKYLVIFGELTNQFGVERLHETCVRHSR